MNSLIPESFLTDLREGKFYKNTRKLFLKKQRNQKVMPISKDSHYI